MKPGEEMAFAEEIAETVAVLSANSAAGEITVTVNVTNMCDEKVAEMRKQFDAAGLGLVMFDGNPTPRPGTLPLAAAELDDELVD